MPIPNAVFFLACFRGLKLGQQAYEHQTKSSPIKPVFFSKPKKDRLHENNLAPKKVPGQNNYFFEIYITRTDLSRGRSGHVSASMIQQTEQGAEVSYHTSYMPSKGLPVNLASLGTIPVFSSIMPKIRTDDLAQVDQIIRIPLSKDQFHKGVEYQKNIDAGVNRGSHLYAVFSTSNIFTLFLVALINGYRLSEHSMKQSPEFFSVEDPMGLLVTQPNETIPYYPSTAINCTTAIQQILEELGFKLNSNYVIPSSLADAILEDISQAELVNESLATVYHIENSSPKLL